MLLRTPVTISIKCWCPTNQLVQSDDTGRASVRIEAEVLVALLFES